jgi:alkylation response protein AidB-like acyl-CoA dehydrogenase
VASPDLGGLGMPQSLGACVSELSTGANMGLATYPGLAASAGSLLSHYAPEPLRTLVCTKMFSGEWGGTMCLTEAGAGSSVGDNRCKALPTEEPGVFELTGEKVFITGGDQDLTDNIMHLVLARTPGAPAGTKGISIFLVPKYWFDMDGTMGDRNGAYVEKIEEKMGLHGSATCVLSLGARGRCRGWLLGKENQGMAIMFHMMNEARIQVGAQGLAGAAAAYQNALTYARTRVQGQPVERFGDNTAASVTIVNHPDVRRMLMWQKVHVETMRSFVYSLANRLDRAENGTDEAEKEYLHGLVDLMTPVVKSYCSDRGFESTVLAMQVYGGYGYIGEYPVEQIVRDTKISSIYEGTNGIQAMDLVGRKMRKGGGMLFMQWLQEVNDELEKCKELPELAPAVADLEKAKDGVGAAAMHIGGLGMEGNIRGAMLNASNFLDQLGCVVLGMHALWQARVALSKLAGASEGDARYYKGKLLNLQFYVGSVLPRATALGKIIRSNDMSCLDEALFGEL